MEEKATRINVIQLSNRQIKFMDLNVDDLKKHSHPHHMLVSPTSQARMRKSSNERWNCLCSPTTHVGSFRCRRHRSGGVHRARSVGSTLSAMGSKHSLQPQ
ncbi:hypothetical protein SESBI_21632 [Sesbania bispinosa]|nr:hypothetical protein SESBI_21632 [Sesbania bispinosa]